MTIEEQAAMYEAGVKAYMEGTRMDKDYLSRVLAQGTRDHMALETLYLSEDAAVFKEQAARHMEDDEFFERLMKYMRQPLKEARFVAQRPLIHNGRKMRKNGN